MYCSPLFTLEGCGTSIIGIEYIERVQDVCCMLVSDIFDKSLLG